MKSNEPQRLGDLLRAAGGKGRGPSPVAGTASTSASAAASSLRCEGGADRDNAGATGAPDRPGEGASAKVAEADIAQHIAAVWSEVVGVEVAANALPTYYRNGRLVVSTSSSAWAQTLLLMSEMLKSRLNARLGGEHIRQVRFRHAGWEEAIAPGFASSGAAPTPPAPLAATAQGVESSTAERRPAGGQPGLAASGLQPQTVESDRPAPAAALPPLPLSKEPSQPVRMAPGAPPGALTRAQTEALEALDQLRLPDNLKVRIRAAMQSAFVREGKDSVR